MNVVIAGALILFGLSMVATHLKDAAEALHRIADATERDECSCDDEDE